MNMEDKTYLGKGLLEDCTERDAIDWFGTGSLVKEAGIDEVMEAFSRHEIADWIEGNEDVLTFVDDDVLIENLNDSTRVLGDVESEDMIEVLEERGYEVFEEYNVPTDHDIMNRIQFICRSLQPIGYIGKDDAKKLLCDYIELWMNRGF